MADEPTVVDVIFFFLSDHLSLVVININRSVQVNNLISVQRKIQRRAPYKIGCRNICAAQTELDSFIVYLPEISHYIIKSCNSWQCTQDQQIFCFFFVYIDRTAQPVIEYIKIKAKIQRSCFFPTQV